MEGKLCLHTATFTKFVVTNSGLLINCNKKESDDVNKHIDKSLQNGLDVGKPKFSFTVPMKGVATVKLNEPENESLSMKAEHSVDDTSL